MYGIFTTHTDNCTYWHSDLKFITDDYKKIEVQKHLIAEFELTEDEVLELICNEELHVNKSNFDGIRIDKVETI